ncbi:hypothetical protein [Haliangium ochraceum]|uniref:hypothetical protein n=1 Tax=Haliangium ochraceum TaxID=80816 RepID=UPI00019BA66F|nr:hypothetical protein [Haliangium ochraceum]
MELRLAGLLGAAFVGCALCACSGSVEGDGTDAVDAAVPDDWTSSCLQPSRERISLYDAEADECVDFEVSWECYENSCRCSAVSSDQLPAWPACDLCTDLTAGLCTLTPGCQGVYLLDSFERCRPVSAVTHYARACAELSEGECPFNDTCRARYDHAVIIATDPRPDVPDRVFLSCDPESP